MPPLHPSIETRITAGPNCPYKLGRFSNAGIQVCGDAWPFRVKRGLADQHKNRPLSAMHPIATILGTGPRGRDVPRADIYLCELPVKVRYKPYSAIMRYRCRRYSAA